MRAALRRAAGAALLSFALPAAAYADDASGYAGKGSLVIQTSLGETKLTVGGDIAFEERDTVIRIDILSLGIPGADPTLSAVMSTQLFPPGGFTVIYDRKQSTYTVWSNAKRLYYSPPQKPAASFAPPHPRAVRDPRCACDERSLRGIRVLAHAQGRQVVCGTARAHRTRTHQRPSVDRPALRI